MHWTGAALAEPVRARTPKTFGRTCYRAGGCAVYEPAGLRPAGTSPVSAAHPDGERRALTSLVMARVSGRAVVDSGAGSRLRAGNPSPSDGLAQCNFQLVVRRELT